MESFEGEVWYWTRFLSSHGGSEVFEMAESLIAKMVEF